MPPIWTCSTQYYARSLCPLPLSPSYLFLGLYTYILSIRRGRRVAVDYSGESMDFGCSLAKDIPDLTVLLSGC